MGGMHSVAGLPPLAVDLVLGAASAVAVAAAILAAASDAESRRIPNGLSLLLLLSGLAALTALSPADALLSVGLAALLFAAGLFAFSRGIAGGGDVKLLTGAMLWSGPALLGLFAVTMALAAIATSTIILFRQALTSPSHVASWKTPMPLGIPIAAGAIAVILERLALLPGTG